MAVENTVTFCKNATNLVENLIFGIFCPRDFTPCGYICPKDVNKHAMRIYTVDIYRFWQTRRLRAKAANKNRQRAHLSIVRQSKLPIVFYRYLQRA